MSSQGDVKYIDENSARIMPNIIENKPLSIPGFEGYYADRFGNIFHVVNGSLKWLKGYESNGYIAVNLGNVPTSVARIVAKIFIPNDDPAHKTRVYHIDGNFWNNDADNLAWVEPKDVKHLWAMTEDQRREYLEEKKDEIDL